MNTGEDRDLVQEEQILEKYWQEVMGKTDDELANMSDDEFYSVSVDWAICVLSHD